MKTTETVMTTQEILHEHHARRAGGEATQPSILCAVCNKSVDRIVVTENQQDFTLSIRVYCHGERDEMSLPLSVLVVHGKEILNSTGIAFQHRRIEKEKQ